MPRLSVSIGKTLREVRLFPTTLASFVVLFGSVLIQCESLMMIISSLQDPVYKALASYLKPLWSISSELDYEKKNDIRKTVVDHI